MEKMKKQYLVNYANVIDFENDGQRVQGVKLQVLSDDIQSEHEKGSRVAEYFLPYDLKTKITKIPALYDLTFTMRVDRNSKFTLQVADIDYVKDCKIYY